MKKINEFLNEIKTCKELQKKIFLLSIITLLFICILIFKSTENNSKYIVDRSGNLVGIERKRMDKNEQFHLTLSILKNGKKSERSVDINKQANENPAQNKNTNKQNEALERESEINEIITNIELSNNKIISFPSKLLDGSLLIWSREENNGIAFLYIPLGYFILAFLLIKSSLDSKNEVDNEKRGEILRALPRFTNQLLLMMNAGMILSDAFERIVLSYEIMGESERGYFENELIALGEKNYEHRVSTASLINKWANSHNIKELLRISTILTENERRGSNIIDNLSRESKYLWDDRKIIAREAGKMIDTKMSYPMGLLLLLLIVITMAPAIMNL